MNESTANPAPQPDSAPVAQAPPAASTGSKLLTIAILLVSAALIFVWIRSDPAGPQAGAAGAAPRGKVGSPAPKMVLKDLAGNVVSLEDLKGKVVLVDFWATWCQPCTVLIPWFIEFKDRYGPQGFEIVGISMDEEGAEVVKPYAEKSKMNYPIVIGTEATAEEWGGIFGLPTSFLIDRQGNIRSRHVGLVSRDVFEKEIRELL